MGNRLLIVFYGLAIAWLIFMLTSARTSPESLPTALIIGAPPLILVALIHFVTAGRR